VKEREQKEQIAPHQVYAAAAASEPERATHKAPQHQHTKLALDNKHFPPPKTHTCHPRRIIHPHAFFALARYLQIFVSHS